MEHLLKRIISNPEIFSGKQIIRGYRIRVQDILEMLAGGMKEEEILSDFDYLEADDIKACLLYAALKMSHPVIHAA
jgi:uncharacterized protein (DUF433 family)